MPSDVQGSQVCHIQLGGQHGIGGLVVNGGVACTVATTGTTTDVRFHQLLANGCHSLVLPSPPQIISSAARAPNCSYTTCTAFCSAFCRAAHEVFVAIFTVKVLYGAFAGGMLLQASCLCRRRCCRHASSAEEASTGALPSHRAAFTCSGAQGGTGGGRPEHQRCSPIAKRWLGPPACVLRGPDV